MGKPWYQDSYLRGRIRFVIKSINTVEWAQWDVFPSLDITGAPIVHQDNSEDVVLGVIDGNRVSKLIFRANEESHLELNI